MIANIPDVAWTSDAEGNPIFVSSNSERVYGFTSQETCTPGFFSSRIHPDNHEKVATAYKAFLEGHAAFDEEFRIQRKDGQWIWVHDRAVATYEKNGKLYTDGVISDITKRKQAEEALAQERNLLRALIDNMPDWVFAKDLQSRYVIANIAVARALGYEKPEEIIGKNDFDFSPIPLAAQYIADDRAVIASGQAQISQDELGVDSATGPRWLSTTKVPLRDGQGNVVGLVAVCRDATERKRAEEALRTSESRYRLLFETSVAATIRSMLDGRVVDCNHNAAQILGYGSPHEVVGLSMGNLYWDPEKRGDLMARLKGERTLAGFEVQFRHKNGSPIWLIVNLSLTPPDETGEVLVQATFVDITARKRAEEQLRLTQYSVDHASDAVHWLDPQGRFVYVNEACSRSLGYSREELLRMSIAEIDPSLAKGGWELAWETLKARGSMTFETQHQGKEGRAFPVEVNANHLEFNGKEYSFAYARDITERKRVEEQLRKVSVAVEQSPASVIITDVQGNIEYVNPKFTQLTGYTAEETIGQNPRVLSSGMQSADVYRELWTTLLAGGEWRGEFANRKKNGDIYWEAAAIVPIRDSGGAIKHFLAVKEDITDRKRTEEALRASEQRYRALFQRNLAGVYRTTLDGRILECNQAAAHMFGYDSPEAILSLPVSSPYTAASDRDAFVAKLSAEKSVTNYEMKFRRKSGEAFWVIGNMNLVMSDSGAGVIEGTLIDITARKHAEAELYQSRQMLQSVLDNIPQRVFWKDLNSIYLGCNRALAADCGLQAPAEIVGKSDFDLAWSVAADLYRADDRQVMEQGSPKLGYSKPRTGPMVATCGTDQQTADARPRR